MEAFICKHCHHMALDDLRVLFETDLKNGLSAAEVKRRLVYFGPNVLSMKKPMNPLLRFLLQFHQPLVYILMAAGFITAGLQEWVDSSVIFGVVIVNAIIGFVQESKAESAIESLKNMVVTEATVLRGGKKLRIPSADLVPGDVVLLQSGDKVPADLRLHSITNLQIDESALTGESLPVAKKEELLPHDTVLADRKNMAFAGTLATYGQGQGVVVATGNKTETGRISQLISEAVEISTPLTRKIAKFSTLLLYVIVGLAVLTFVIGLFRGEPLIEMFMAAVALAVGAIPEGLPAAVTITLAIGVKRMAQVKAIIRKLPAVETLGSTTVICSDKTGTLTQNQMTVQQTYAGDKLYHISGSGYLPEGKISHGGAVVEAPLSDPLSECLVAGVLCNDSQLIEADGRWSVQGDPTEAALLTAAAKGGFSAEELTTRLLRLNAIPFESEYQYMATLHDTGSNQPTRAYVKGAVEKIVEKCATMLSDSGDLGPIDAAKILKTADAMAAQGLRVLGFARKEIPRESPQHFEHKAIESGLTFLGLQGMIDPPRPEAVAAIGDCKTAGISVRMVTGDHALTARAIAVQLGLSAVPTTDKTPITAVTGKEMAQVSDQDLIDTAECTTVFARVAPEQKLKLVDAFQTKNHVVAMTGDGVNDAPALKQADIGVAMGITGTDVAKDAADMILTDDNFASIVSAVKEGRRVFDNLTKFILWTLPTNMGEGLVILAAIFAGVTLPILPVQILWINMTTAILLGLMLAFEPEEADIMKRPPREPDAPILTSELIGRIIVVSSLLLAGAFGLFVWYKLRGADLAVARTVAVNVFVMGELFYLFNCRSLSKSIFEIGFFTNPWVIAGPLCMITLQLLFTYVPFMNTLFQSSPITLSAWFFVLLLSSVIYAVVGIEKWIRRRSKAKKSPQTPFQKCIVDSPNDGET